MTQLFAFGGGANLLSNVPGGSLAPDPHTLAAWVYGTSIANGNEFAIMGLTGGGFSLLGGSSAGGLAANQIKHRLTNSAGSANSDLIVACSQNAWHHVAATYDGTTQRIYVDGVQASSATPGYGSRTGTINFVGVGPCDGTVSDAAFYTAALSAADIFELYSARQPTRRTNLVASYPLFSGTSAKLVDYSGNARTLTLNGTVTDGTLQPPAAWGTTGPTYVVTSTPLALGPASGASVSGGSAQIRELIALAAAVGNSVSGGSAQIRELIALAAAAGHSISGGTAAQLIQLVAFGASSGNSITGGSGTMTQIGPFAGVGASVSGGSAQLRELIALAAARGDSVSAGSGNMTGGTAAGGGSSATTFGIAPRRYQFGRRRIR